MTNDEWGGRSFHWVWCVRRGGVLRLGFATAAVLGWRALPLLGCIKAV